ncbi:MAG: endonuclease [Myxococcales bacterium]|nr:endonuclease [Myxococcales bacterium]
MANKLIDERLAALVADPKVPDATRALVAQVLASTRLDARFVQEFAARCMAVLRDADDNPHAQATLKWFVDLAAQTSPALFARFAAAPQREEAPAKKQRDGRSVACFSPGEACLDMIIACFERVTATADVCVFTITDDRIGSAIARAHRRGVKVRVISDNDKAYDEGSDIEGLRRLGIACRVDETEAHMHHKFAVFDREILLTGSYNWTRSAARYNEENLIVTEDPRLVADFMTEFESLWAKFA